MQVPAEALVLGAVVGLGYGLLAVGILLVFRASRVLNFAQGAIGYLSAALVAYAVVRWELPYGLALTGGALVGALVAAPLAAVMHRLRDAPPLMGLVATLGAGQALGLLGSAVLGELPPATPLPEPGGIEPVKVGALRVNASQLVLAVVGPVAVGFTWWLLRRTTVGLALRAAADNPDAARTIGLPAGWLTAVAWALAGALAGLSGPLVLAGVGVPGGGALGVDLLLRALGAALVAGMVSLPLAALAGVGIGIVEQVAFWNWNVSYASDLAVAAIVVSAVMARGRALRDAVEPGSWAAFARRRPLPPAIRRAPRMRAASAVGAAVLVAVVAALPAVAGAADVALFAQVAGIALAGVSVWVIAGLTGGVPLGQIAIVGVGALVAVRVGPPEIGFLLAAPAGAAAGLVAGWLSRRDPGLVGAVVGLAFAVVVADALLGREWALGERVSVSHLRLGGLDTGVPTTGYAVAVGALAVATAIVGQLARSLRGVRMRAVRDNERAARAFGIRAELSRLEAAVVAGAVAGLAGAVLVQASATIAADRFMAARAIDLLAIAVLGGLAVAWGPAVGALYVVALPVLFDLPSAALAASAVGWLLLILYVPTGLGGLLENLRDSAARTLVGGKVQAEPPQRAEATLPPPALEQTRNGALVLEELVVRFGQVRAVDGVSLAVGAGEIVGLIGPNGAGKSSLLDLVSGFLHGDGTVSLGGRRLDPLPPELRARAGLVRGFQQPVLFPTLSVGEVAALASEDHEALLGAFGLRPWAEHRVRELSTGTRRALELACAAALAPRALILDEPSAGLAQGELRALVALLRAVRERTGAAMLIVEHDLALVRSLADRVVVMDQGRLR